jgi:polysaccharide pyruvyl transferase WcaK-like protein
MIGNKGNTIIVLAPSHEGSLGDQAVLRGLGHALSRGAKNSDLVLVHFGAPEEWNGIPYYSRRSRFSRFFGTPTVFDRVRMNALLRRSKAVYIPGTDVLDGFYSKARSIRRIEFASLAASSSNRVSIAGFSINAKPDADCMEAFARLPAEVRLTNRELESQRRLLEGSGKASELTADLAFLMPADQSSGAAMSAASWINGQREQGRLVVGINVNKHLALKESPEVFRALVANIAAGINEVNRCWDGGVSVVFLPHDLRPKHDDREAGSELFSLLDQSLREHSLLLERDLTADLVKGVAGQLDFMFTGRMHVAIAALGMCTPTACMVYQGKFEGLFRHVGIADNLISPEDARNPEILVRFLLSEVERRMERRNAIERQHSRLIELALNNLHPNDRPSIEAVLGAFGQGADLARRGA